MEEPRHTHIQNRLKTENLDALLITNPTNIRYLTGFSGHAPDEREAILYLTQRDGHLFTYSTYYDGIPTLPYGIEKHLLLPERRLTSYLSDISSDQHISTIGYEADSLTMSEYLRLSQSLQAEWKPAPPLIEALRAVKDKKELSFIKKAAQITDQVFSMLIQTIHKGQSESDIAWEIESTIKKQGADISFPPIVAFDTHSAVPHHTPSPSTHLKNLQHTVLLDFGAKIHGYCADLTRMLYIGTPPDRIATIHNTVLAAQEKVLSYLQTVSYSHPVHDIQKSPARKADEVAKTHISSCGFTAYTHGLGHGVGLGIHEAPRLSALADMILSPGMIVTVEPGIYIPSLAGVRIEDLVSLESKGITVLSTSPKEIISLTL